MHHGLVAAEHPVVAVRALDAHACLVAGHHRGPAQSGERRLTARAKRACARRSMAISPPWLMVSPNRSDSAL